jgi:hypothetical protein
MNASDEQKKRYPEIFAENESPDLGAITYQVVAAYYDSLRDGEKATGDVGPDFKAWIAHNQLFVNRYFANLMMQVMTDGLTDAEKEGVSIATLDGETGEVQVVVGGEELADQLVEMGDEYIEALKEGRIQEGPKDVQ